METCADRKTAQSSQRAPSLAWLGEHQHQWPTHGCCVSIQTSDSSVSLSRDSHCPPSSISHQDLPKPQDYSLANLSKSWGSLLVCPEVLRTYILGGRYKGQGGSATPHWQRAFLSSPHPAAPRSPSLCGLRLYIHKPLCMGNCQLLNIPDHISVCCLNTWIPGVLDGKGLVDMCPAELIRFTWHHSVLAECNSPTVSCKSFQYAKLSASGPLHLLLTHPLPTSVN